MTLAKPTPAQLAWHDTELGMFIHFSPGTYENTGGGHDTLTIPPSAINPYLLDTEQWVDVAEAMGAKYVVLVAKHVGGFCLWQTETTDYGVAAAPWRDGKGDIMGDLAESCRRRGLPLGVYLSPQDRHFGANVGGVCASPERQAQYDVFYRRQLTEVLTRYGEMFEVWFDGRRDDPFVRPPRSRARRGGVAHHLPEGLHERREIQTIAAAKSPGVVGVA